MCSAVRTPVQRRARRAGRLKERQFPGRAPARPPTSARLAAVRGGADKVRLLPPVVNDPARRRARRAHLIWVGIAGTIVAGHAAALLADRPGFIDLTDVYLGAMFAWYLGAVLISTGLVWFRSRGLRSVVVFNLVGLVATPVLAVAGTMTVTALRGASLERTMQQQAGYGQVTRWRVSRTAPGRWVLEGDFESGFTGRLRAETFDGMRSAELDAVEGKTVTFVVGPGGSIFNDGFRLYFDGVNRQVYRHAYPSDTLDRGVLHRPLPPRQPSDGELDDEEQRAADTCLETVPPGQIAFRVTGANQQGRFAGATLRVKGCGRELTATSDRDGLARLTVPPGDYQLGGAVGGEDAFWRGEAKGVRSGEVLEIDYGMPGPVPEGVRGRLFVAWGRGETQLLPNTPLALRGESGELLTTHTDPDGRFEQRLAAGRYHLEASLGDQALRAPVTLTYGWKELGDVHLSPARGAPP